MGIYIGVSTEWLFIQCFLVELELEMLAFVEGGKNLSRNPRCRDENEQQTQPINDVNSSI